MKGTHRLNQSQNQIAGEFAIGICFSGTAGLSYDDIMGALEDGEFPEGVEVWEPFEGQSAVNLSETLFDMKRVLSTYGEKLLEAN